MNMGRISQQLRIRHIPYSPFTIRNTQFVIAKRRSEKLLTLGVCALQNLSLRLHTIREGTLSADT
jgi:hypothetical protein